MTPAGPTPENEGIDPELQAAVESAFEEVPDDVREELAQGASEDEAGQADAASQGAADSTSPAGGSASSDDEDIVDAEIVDDEDSK